MAKCNNTMNKSCDVNGCNVTYIGAKYLTTFASPILWDINTNYEPFTIVQDEQENSYISKGYVPAGIELTDAKYWALIYQFNTQIKNISDRVTIVEGDITALESKTDQTNTDLTALTARVSTAEGDITALESKTDQTNTDLTALTARVSTAEGDITALESKTDQTNTDLTALTARVSTAEGDITALESKTDQTNTDLTALTARVSTAEGDITALESKTDQTNTDLTALTARVSTAEGDITALDQFRPTSETFALPSSLTGTGYKIHTPTNPASNGNPQNKIVDIMINATAQATSTGYLIIGFTALANPNYVVSVTPVDSTSGGEVYGKYRYGIKNKTNSGFDLYALDESGNNVTTGLLSFSIHIKGVEQ